MLIMYLVLEKVAPYCILMKALLTFIVCWPCPLPGKESYDPDWLSPHQPINQFATISMGISHAHWDVPAVKKLFFCLLCFCHTLNKLLLCVIPVLTPLFLTTTLLLHSLPEWGQGPPQKAESHYRGCLACPLRDSLPDVTHVSRNSRKKKRIFSC